MIIGITGRGGSGKTTLAKKITENHQDFCYIEVDKLITEKFENSQTLMERVNRELGSKYNKKYSFNDLRKAYFGTDEESRELHAIFIEELNKLINETISKVTNKNIVIEYFFLDKFDVYNMSDIKIHLYADLEERVKRVNKRGNMTEELFRAVDCSLVENEDIKSDFAFNIADYQSELVSIIIPVYNGEEYISETLDAVLEQTYQNLEVIIVNDGSTDNTLNILNDYSKRDSRIKVITTPNMNVSNARNTGLDNATGEYVAFVDSDDLIDRNYIAALYDTLKVSNADYSHSSVSIERDGIPHMVTFTQNQLIKYDNPVNSFLELNTTFSVWCKLFKREVINDIRFDNINCFEDFKYMWEVSKKAKSCAVTSDTKYHYIQRNHNSLTSGLYNDSNIELIKHAFTVLKEANYSDEAKKYFFGCLFHNVMLYYGSLNNPNFIDNYQQEIFLCIKYLELYKDYEFQLLEYNLLDVQEIINDIKDRISIKTIAILWNSMEDFYEEAMIDLQNYGVIEKYVDLNFSSSEFKEFIDKIYPHTDSDYWKTEYKTAGMVDKYKNNRIRVIYLSLLKSDKLYDDRKNEYIYPSVINLKQRMREKYSKKVVNYKFDNVFHMTDDESEYYITDALIEELLLAQNREDSRIVLDKLPLVEGKEEKRKKYFYQNFMFKETRAGSFEDYAELFNEEVLKLLNIDCTFYDLALYQGKKGVITSLFTSKDSFVSGYDIISLICNTSDIKKIMQYNNIESLSKIIEQFLIVNGGDLSHITQIMDGLKKIAKYDLVTLQSDRNPFNWGLVKKGGIWSLAPVFDNSNCANFNHLERDPFNIHVLLKFNNNDSYNVYDVLNEHPEIAKDVLEMISVIANNIEFIFRRMELKIGNKVPDDVKEAIYSVYNTHFRKISNIYRQIKLVDIKLLRSCNISQ